MSSGRAARIVDSLDKLGIEVRVGLHIGEVQLAGGDVRGIAVNLAARIMAAAPGGSILVSRTVRDLVARSEIEFADRGTHTLKDVPGEWELYEVVSAP